ncbi:ABC transporter ATP-binding protein [Rhizohabitans arisaemae]|uniref:ABC transporter ATP-binding protein n=1 Tax=Rhizohabitans arisaemae TaxID=2720610 RepID=UPI0024B0595C|nr:ABC transporter ATP-binding protein [Rhizohabitans arisaemae]
MIEVKNLHKQYPNHVAVHDVSFSVAEGEIFGIIGPNGAGKTTTVECVEGLRVPDGGTVSVLGLDPRRDAKEVRQSLGVQLQESSLPDNLKVWEALDLYCSFYRKPANPDRLLEDWGLTEKRNSPFGKLSGGQKQRLFIALALVGNPRIAILDELTTGLDPQARRDTWDLIEGIRDSGVTVVLVTHFMEEAERLCDRVAVIAKGRVVALDTPAGLIAQVESTQRLRFRGEVDERILKDLPEVSEVHRTGDQVVVSGTGELLQVVSLVLARHRIGVRDLRLERASLDDVFTHLTEGRTS